MTWDVSHVVKEAIKDPYSIAIIFMAFFGTGFYWLLNKYAFDFSNMKVILGIDGIILLSITIAVFFLIVLSVILIVMLMIVERDMPPLGVLLFSTFISLSIITGGSKNPYFPMEEGSPARFFFLILLPVIFFILTFILANEK